MKNYTALLKVRYYPQHVGIRVPRVRVLEYTGSEWHKAKRAIKSMASAADPTGVDAQKVEKELDRAFIMGITWRKCAQITFSNTLNGTSDGVC